MHQVLENTLLLDEEKLREGTPRRRGRERQRGMKDPARWSGGRGVTRVARRGSGDETSGRTNGRCWPILACGRQGALEARVGRVARGDHNGGSGAVGDEGAGVRVVDAQRAVDEALGGRDHAEVRTRDTQHPDDVCGAVRWEARRDKGELRGSQQWITKEISEKVREAASSTKPRTLHSQIELLLPGVHVKHLVVHLL